ncbi:hypothetical protein G7Y79_00005g016210 [Physcia stellaris]|nr:hypothetical protein G7Y79_00005g016210 [Physcia stellaris]
MDKISCKSEYKPYLKYDPLPQGHVRLLRFQGSLISDYEDEIEISLITAPLSNCPPYITLSYTWECPEPVQDPKTIIFTKVARCFPIKCGGKLLLGTHNLRNALRALRKVENSQQSATADSAITPMRLGCASFDQNQLYWIDAICINQEDIQERSRQVSLMSLIYSQAQCTVVWLGERDRYTESSMRVLLKVMGDHVADDSIVELGDTRPTKTKFEGIYRLSDDEIIALGMLFARKWFSRTWVVQEVVLSRTVMTLWGTVYFSFDILTKVATVMSHTRSSLRFISRFSTIGSSSRLESAVQEKFWEMSSALPILQTIESSRVDLQNDMKPSFMKVVRMCRASKSSDLRDKIYGILGIAAELENSGEGDSTPDYNLTIAEVYMRATTVVIRSRSDLACLTLTGDESYKNVKGLTSWCPDYSTHAIFLRECDDVTRKWQLGLSWSNALSPKIVGTSNLRVDGSLFDVVAEISCLTENPTDRSIHHGLSTVFELATRLEDEQGPTSVKR